MCSLHAVYTRACSNTTLVLETLRYVTKYYVTYLVVTTLRFHLPNPLNARDAQGCNDVMAATMYEPGERRLFKGELAKMGSLRPTPPPQEAPAQKKAKTKR